jgi:hypothetical protein
MDDERAGSTSTLLCERCAGGHACVRPRRRGYLSFVARKPPEERTRPQIGDVIEVETPTGLAYVQYTHEHRERPRWGSLLRVLPGVYERQPDLAKLVSEEERFSVFFPLHAALRGGIFSIVANEPVPPAKQQFPIFRMRQEGFADGPWYYWDGHREWRERSWRRTPRWRARALQEIWNDTLLIERIAAGWSPPVDDAAPG